MDDRATPQAMAQYLCKRRNLSQDLFVSLELNRIKQLFIKSEARRYGVKSMHVKSHGSLLLSVDDFVDTVNRLRRERAEDDNNKKPLNAEEAFSSMRLLENRDSDHGMIYFRLRYNDSDGIPCTRDFPNFGLSIQSKSSMNMMGNQISIDVDLKLSASSAKWQRNEISECHEIFSYKDASLVLMVTLDETADWAGYSAQLPVIGGNSEEVKLSEFSLT